MNPANVHVPTSVFGRGAIDCCQGPQGSAREPLESAPARIFVPEGRENIAAIAAILAGTLAMGCTLNTSALHSDLSDAELARRIQQRFYKGMPGPQVMDKIEDNRLRAATGKLPSRTTFQDEPLDRGVCASLDPTGLYRVLASDRKSGDILFWFDDADRLEQVAIQRARQSRAAGMPPYRIEPVALRERPQ